MRRAFDNWLFWLSLLGALLALFSRYASAQAPLVEFMRDQAAKRVISIKAVKGAASPAMNLASSADALDSADRFLARYGSAMGLVDSSRELTARSSVRDELGMLHVHYDQMYEGVPVFGGQVMVHLENDQVVFVNGEVAPKISVDTVPLISEGQAIERAKGYYESRFTSVPSAVREVKLYIIDRGFLEKKEGDGGRLVWRVQLTGLAANEYYFIDARTGELVYQLTGRLSAVSRYVYDCCPYPESFGCYVDKPDIWYGSGYIFGRSEGKELRGPNPWYWSSCYALTDTDDLYAIIGAAYEYYWDRFSRDGANGLAGMGNGTEYAVAKTRGVTFIEQYGFDGCPNAFFDDSTSDIRFCGGVVATDIVGHEYNHAVDYYSVPGGGLIYANQPGALNESFADIFGEALERYRHGSNDWVAGASLSGRSMSNPPATSSIFGPYPDTFHSPYYYCGSDDYGGVHHNNGVPNKAAYLITAGGGFNGCTISGLGWSKAEQVFYRALTRYFTASTGFNGAYAALLQACSDLASAGTAGITNSDCEEVDKALQAVEMDQGGRCSGAAEEIPGCAPGGDRCPSDPNKTAPRVCGCGVPDQDLNGNGVYDCLDPVVQGVTPRRPMVQGQRRKVYVEMTPLSGVKYVVRAVVQNYRQKKKKTYYFESASSYGTITGLKSKASVTVSYRYKLEGATPLYSLYSPKKKVKVK